MITFTEAIPLLRALERSKEQFIGQQINGYDTSNRFGELVDTPVAFVLDDKCIAIEFLQPSRLRILITDLPHTKAWKVPEFGTYLFRDEETFPFLGRKIEAVKVMRFSREFTVDPVTDGIRPKGGDYFSDILIQLEDGNTIRIVAEDAMFDGYMTVKSE